MGTICLFVAGPKGPVSPRFRSSGRKRSGIAYVKLIGPWFGGRYVSLSTTGRGEEIYECFRSAF